MFSSSVAFSFGCFHGVAIYNETTRKFSLTSSRFGGPLLFTDNGMRAMLACGLKLYPKGDDLEFTDEDSDDPNDELFNREKRKR